MHHSPSFSACDRSRSIISGQSRGHLRIPENRSAHLSPDRITRHAAPHHRMLESQTQEVVARIPQPYRTSFSAVTAPRRQACSSQSPITSDGSVTSGDLSPQQPCTFVRNGSSHFSSIRSKSASDSNVLDSDFNAAHDSIRSQCFYGSNPATKVSSKDNVTSSPGQQAGLSFGSDTSISARHGGSSIQDHRNMTKTQQLQHRLEALKSRAGECNHITSMSQDVCTEYKPSEEYMNSTDNYEIVNRCSSPVEYSSCVDSPEFSEFTSDFNSSSTDKLYYADQSLIKDVIERHYEHVTNVDYYEFMNNKQLVDDQNEVTDKMLQEAVQSKMAAAGTPEEEQKNSQKNKHSPGDKQNRSVSNSPSSSRKKSISTSISNFFSRMSPKSLRKSLQTEKKRKSGGQSDTSSVCSNSDKASISSENSEKITAKPPKSHKSPKLLPLKLILGEQNRKDNSKCTPVRSQSEEILDSPDMNLGTQPLPSSGSRLLKSLNSKNSADKSVYQTFKEKHSPFRPSETPPNKTQALRATTPHNHGGNSPNINSAPSDGEHTPTGVNLKPIDGDGTPVGLHKSREPPRTLDVRDVTKLSKSFKPYSFSTESIGQCSLDAYASKVGSEPSLVSANGQRSNDSKRTLHSGDPVSSASLKHGSVDIPSKQQCKSDSTLDKVDTYESSWGRSKETPNTPSYVRISCSVSGYGHKYSAISPDKEPARLKVIKKSPPPQTQRNGAPLDETDHSIPLLHNSSPLVNGYLPDINGHLITENTSPLNGEMVVHSSTELSQSKSGKKRYLTSIKVRPSSISASLSSCSLSSTELEKEQNDSLDNHMSNHGNGHNDATHRSNSSDKITALFSDILHQNERDINTDKITDATSVTQQSLATEESLTLNLTAEEEPVLEKNARYFLDVVQKTADHLNSRCEQVEALTTDQSLSEEVLGKLRAAIGKANLLTSKKFKQFRGLCEQNLNQTGDEQFITTTQDLEGFWDMVLIQVEDVNALFEEIEQLRANGWKEIHVNTSSSSSSVPGGRSEKTHMRQNSSGSSNIQLTPRGTSSGSKGKSPRGKENTSESTSKLDRAAKAKEAARIRDEARKRLMAAKRAGRKRVASQSDNTEIEIIYAPE